MFTNLWEGQHKTAWPLDSYQILSSYQTSNLLKSCPFKSHLLGVEFAFLLLMKIFILLFSLISMSAFAQVPLDYGQCSEKQLNVIKGVKNFHYKKSKELLSMAARITETDKRSLEMKQHLFRLANESFIKNMALEKVTETFEANSSMATSISGFKTAFDESMKSKLILTDAVEGFRQWSSSNGLNSRAFSALSSNLKNEIIERAFMTFGGKVIDQLSDEESFILGITSEIGLNAAFYYSGKLVTSRAIGRLSVGTVAKWAGGPTGIILTLAPLFMSGTLPTETKWTDFLHEHPRLLMDPAQGVKAKLARDAKDAMYIHCLSWERREKSMNSINKKMLQEFDDEIKDSIVFLRKKHEAEEKFKQSPKVEVDNTYVKKPMVEKILIKKTKQ